MSNKNKKNKLALGVTAAALVVSAVPAATVPASAAESTEEQKVLYFDEMESYAGYRPHASYSGAGHGKPTVHANATSTPLSLLVGGELHEFTKGYSTFGKSKVVFDARFEDKNTFTRAVGKIGINAANKGVGDGVHIKIYQGHAPNSIKLVETLSNVTADKDATSINLDLATNGYYMEFVVESKGSDNGDNVFLADMKLVETDYKEVVEETTIKGLKRIADYDAILSKNTPEQNLENHKMEILQREFVDKVGYQVIQNIADTNEGYAEAIEYLLNNETALTYLMTGGPASKDGSYSNSIRYFCDIYIKHTEAIKDAADNHFNLRLAISTALVYAKPVLATSWYGASSGTDPVERYEIYQELVESGKMDEGGDFDGFNKWSTQQFKDLPVPMMRWVVSNRINNDEIHWLTDLALENKEAGKNYLDAYNYIRYTTGYNYGRANLYAPENEETFSEKYGDFTEYFDNYGQKNLARLWMVFQEGSVCGGLSKTYHNLATSFGRPSSTMGQPGHAASMTWGWNKSTQRYEWQIQNDISGWAQSGNEYNDRMLNWGNKPWVIWHGASYNILATDAVLDQADFEKATLLNFLANSYESKEDVYEKAVDVQPLNVDSWDGLIKAYKADSSKTSEDYLELAQEIVDTFTYYPQVMMDLLGLIKGKITDGSHILQVDMLQNNALLSASKATATQSTNVTATKQLANKYLKGKDYGPVATFSFSGENAGKIVMSEKYGDSQITLEYSVDGGNEWKQTSDKVIELTDEEIKSITADTDIKVRLLGVDTIHTIDIFNGQSPKGKVQANDAENLLVGNIANLQYSLDGGENWQDYAATTVDEATINPKGVTGIRFNGDDEVKVRYKANGQFLMGPEVTFTFRENFDTDVAKYVQQRHVKVKAASAAQGGRDANFAVDGHSENGYHTKFNFTTQDKHIIFEFDEPRYISAIDYIFTGGNNGRMKDGQILASMDGETWEVIKEFSDMPRDVATQKYAMDKVVQAKYIKLAPSVTHGNTSGEANRYLAMKEVRFYEDLTKSGKVESPVEAAESPVEIVDELPEVPTPSTGEGNESPVEYVESPIVYE